ncbi:MAG: hypothetical protein KJ718_04775 [Nanoarchaeota archaeon]|nr:hypothetical protein [Nanoarchaeota archaeon]MBU1051841.1 hypothetical protein [Nanoarchaeota archaeon]
MFFKKKEDESKLPDLPPLPGSFPGAKGNVASRESVSKWEGSVPAFPKPEGKETKEIVKEKESGDTGWSERKDTFLHPSISTRPEEEKEVKLMEMEEWHPSTSQTGGQGLEFPEHSGLEEVEESESEPEPRYVVEPPPRIVRAKVPEPSSADVFVRIDKFHSARKALTEVGSKLEDINDLVKKIRETKLREEQEITSWEKDLIHLKSRVQTVSENIFEKVE